MKDGAYIRLFGWMFRLGITNSELIVLSYIAENCAMNGGTCTRSLAQFSFDLNMAKNTIKTAVRSLQAAGYIDIEDGAAVGRGNVTRIVVKGSEFDTFFRTEKGQKLILFEDKKGSKNDEKRVKNRPFSEEKGKRSKKEKEINNKKQQESVSNARTREDAEAIIRDYERRRLDPNGTEWTPTAEEQARYEEARQVIRELDRAALVAEFKEVMAKYPDFAGWHQQPTVEQYAVLVERYGRADVAEALAYSANRLDLKWQYANPLAYVEMNIKNRRNRK